MISSDLSSLNSDVRRGAEMRGRLKRLYETIDQRAPLAGRLIRAMWFWRSTINTVKMKHFGINNVIDYRGAFLTSVVFDIHGDGNTILIRDGSVLNGVTFYIRGHDHSVIIGAGCRFDRGGAIWIEDSGCQINIGEGSTFENVHLAVTEPKSKMTIGQDCMFAYDIDIRTGDSHSIFDTGTNARINEAQDVSIGNRVWVAAHCNILKGASIPDDSVVATGSIVTKPFQKTGTILAGNPARVVREGIRWSRERVYLIR